MSSTRNKRGWLHAVACAGLLALCSLAPASFAHELRPGYLEVVETEPLRYDLMWKSPLFAGRPLAISPVFPTDCSTQERSSRQHQRRALVRRLALTCESTLMGRTIALSGLELTLTDVLVRVSTLDGQIQALRATPERPQVQLSAAGSSAGIARTYFVLGVEHILLGIDHLLFVCALVLLIRGWRTLLVTVTAFTVAHSITLISASLGWIWLPSRPVEAVIALSIVFLAHEVACKRDGSQRMTERWPWTVAFAFGLLHGFGFAGALDEIGLPAADVSVALLTFNLGVEAGQLLFVSVLLLTLYLLQRAGQRLRVERLASYAIGITASFWLFERVW